MQVSLFDKEKLNGEEVVIPYQPLHKNDFVGEILVETLGLDEKTLNYLKKASIFKINDLDGRDLLEIRGIGVNSKNRIEKLIKQIYSDINIPGKEGDLVKIIPYKNQSQRIVFLSSSVVKEIRENLIEDLCLDIKTLNYLKKAGYIKINDLLEKDLTKIRGIREGSVCKIKQSIDFFIDNLNKNTIFNLKEFIENTLDERELDIIYDRFGFYREEITLEEKGQALKVTRERIRQIQKKGIFKLKRNIHLQCGNVEFLNYMFDSAQKNLNVSDLLNLPSEYNPKSVVKLFAEMFPKDIFLYSNKLLSVELIVHPKNINTLNNLISEIRDVLSNQTGSVEINELTNHFKCDKKFIEKQKDVIIYNGLVTTKSNKIALGDDKYHLVEQILRNNPRPVHISEIMDKASMTEREVRSMIERMKRKSDVVNVGPSLFSLKEFGYKNLDTKHLIIDLLKEAGEPMSISNLVKSVQNRRVVKKTTILMALTDKNFFYKPIKGYVGLFDYLKN